jgi:predicted nucleotidyltransferase
MPLKVTRPGRPSLGKDKRTRLSMTLKPGLVQRIERRSRAMGVSSSRVVEELLEEGLRAQSLKQDVWQSRLGLDREQIAGYCKSLGVKRLSLFGSILTEKFRPGSDVDLLVEFIPGRIETLLDKGFVQMEFERILGRSVDLAEARLLDNPIRRREILGTALEIYAA